VIIAEYGIEQVFHVVASQFQSVLKLADTLLPQHDIDNRVGVCLLPNSFIPEFLKVQALKFLSIFYNSGF